MKNRGLLSRVSALGFPLLSEEENKDVNLTMADMVKSHDLRFWEAFPVVLADSAEKGLFDYGRVNQYLKNDSDKSHLGMLVTLSLALYKFFKLKFHWADKLCKALPEGKKNEFDKFLASFKKNADFVFAGKKMSAERLKNVFNNYFNQAKNRLNELLSAKDELNLEYALSQVFSPKQKELFLKKLKREKLSKTEKEYYSRVVKKKVAALANPELHRLAQRLLE